MPADGCGLVQFEPFCKRVNEGREWSTSARRIFNTALFFEKTRLTCVGTVSKATGKICRIVAIGPTQGFGIDGSLLRRHPHLKNTAIPTWFDSSRMGTRIRKECFTLEDPEAPAISAAMHKTQLETIIDIFCMEVSALLPGIAVPDDEVSGRMQLMLKPFSSNDDRGLAGSKDNVPYTLLLRPKKLGQTGRVRTRHYWHTVIRSYIPITD